MFTPRELELIRLVVQEGLITKQLPDRMHCELKTCETHRANVMRKIRGVAHPYASAWAHEGSMIDLALYAVVHGLVDMSVIEAKYGAGIPSPS
jgi:DNA-binding CsgD family transcriptional regulator